MNHLSSSQRTSVAITAIVVALVIVGSTAVNAFLMTITPAYAAPGKEKVIERGQGSRAFADWTDISVEVPGIGTVEIAFLDVLETEEGTDIFIQLITEEGNTAIGFTTIDQNVFDIDKKLTSATLSPVTIEVFVFDEFDNFIGTTEITVQATWEGIGDVVTLKSNLREKSGDFSAKFKSSVQGRHAIAEGSINGADLGTTHSAELGTFKGVQMTVSESIIS